MELHFQGNKRIFLLALFGILLVISSLLIYLYDPLQLIIDQQIQLQEGSIIYNIWKNPPYVIYLYVYIFNITNKEAFNRGEEKLRFEEVGPYVYQETLVHVNSTFHDNGTMSYIPQRTVKFVPELSVGHPETDIVIVPNVPLLGIASMLHQSSMFLNLAVLSLMKMLNSQPILNMTVNDFFWGYEDKLVHMASSVLPNWISFTKFGVLDRMYDEGDNIVTINLDDKGGKGSPLIDKAERGRQYSIVTYNGSPGLSQWGYKAPINNETVESNSKCNMLEGAYDGTIFPSHQSKNMSFRFYRKFVCRTIPLEYSHKGTTADNFRAFYFKVKDNFLDRLEDNPDNDCYCRDKNFCLPSGFGDATPCYYGFPAAVSLPHMMNTHPSIRDKIEGMNPSVEKHGSEFVMNPDVGIVLSGFSKMQINLVMWQTKYNARTAPFNNKILPLFWSEMRVNSLPPSLHFLMVLMLKVGPVAQMVVMFLLAIVGAGLIATCGIMGFIAIGTPPAHLIQSPNFNVGYTAIRMIPVIRRESWLRSIRRGNK